MDFRVSLPSWVAGLIECGPKIFPTKEDRMRFVIALALENVRRKTGGPFGAGVFDSRGYLIAPGVNLVVGSNCSILHAEMIAIALAQRTIGRYDISNAGKIDHDLTTSTEPCAMCFGAIHWSGITSLTCGARDEDARGIGFDEGPKLSDWQCALESQGVKVSRDVLRQEAVKALDLYIKEGGVIYNSIRKRHVSET